MRKIVVVDTLNRTYTQYSVVIQAFNKVGSGPLSKEVRQYTAEANLSFLQRMLLVLLSLHRPFVCRGCLRRWPAPMELFRDTKLFTDQARPGTVSKAPAIFVLQQRVST